MNERELERRVRAAFDAVAVPEDVKADALAAIDRLAQDEDGSCGLSARKPASAEPALRARRRAPWPRVAAALAACLVLALVGIGGYRLYAEPTAYVGIDVNPSIELALNRFGIVVAADAANEDGRAVLAAVPVAGKPYQDAVEALASSEAFGAYLQPDAFVEFSVVSDDQQQASALKAQSEACLDRLPCEGSCGSADSELRDEAQSHGMGVGRYKAAQQLMALDPETTLDECAALTMRELRDRIAACEGAQGAAEEFGQASDSHRGNGGGEQGSGNRYGTPHSTRHSA